MGGERMYPLLSSPEEEEELFSEQQFLDPKIGSSNHQRSDDLSTNVENDQSIGGCSPVLGKYDDMDHPVLPNSLKCETAQRRKLNMYREVLQSYAELKSQTEILEAKRKILSYTPGAWIEKAGGMKLSDLDVPKTTTLILIGPKGSGKSSLVNRISRVFEDDNFASDRAQVSYNSSVEDGTYFLQEYMIPRGSTSFCLFDTRGLSSTSSNDMEMLQHWITKGVRHGELVVRSSDSSSLKNRMKCKARRSGHYFSEIRMINFVIFVVDGASMLKSLDGNDEVRKQYCQMVATTFNCPFLSFKDDKPVVVVTHGDLLSLSDRARVRVHLGELLGIPPTKQIFDIPESCDPATETAIVAMIRYSLEHADRNLPGKVWFPIEVHNLPRRTFRACLLLLIALGIAIFAAHVHGAHHKHHAHKNRVSLPHTQIDWHSIRHLWLG